MSKIVRRVLIVDDVEEHRLTYARLVLRADAKVVRTEVGVAADGGAALAALLQARQDGRPFDVVVTDLFMSPLDGIDLINRILEAEFSVNELDIVLVSQQDDAKQRQAEIDGVCQAWQGQGGHLEVVLREGSSDLQSTAHADDFERAVYSGIWRSLHASATRRASPSAAIVQVPDEAVLENAVKCVKHVLPVLLLGETGVGKGHLARQIAKRAKMDLVPADVLETSETLLESHLFGHEKGAFTGAIEKHKGVFEEADGKVLFIDEIGEFSKLIQKKLLTVLQDKAFRRVGGTAAITSDFRLICATNRNLSDEVENGNFREDLYYRIKGFEIEIPPLRDRPQDVHQLAQTIWSNLGSSYNLPDPVLNYLRRQRWPGNVRELERLLEVVWVLSADGRVTLDDVQTHHEPGRWLPGLEDISAPTSRAMHILFMGAAQHCLSGRPPPNTKNDFKKALLERLCDTNLRVFGNTEQEARYRAGRAWESHRKGCPACREVYESLQS